MLQPEVAFQQCISPDCKATYGVQEVHVSCPKCGDLLDVNYDWDRAGIPSSLTDFERFWSQRHDPLRFSGVWRFRELFPFARTEEIVTVGWRMCGFDPDQRQQPATG